MNVLSEVTTDLSFFADFSIDTLMSHEVLTAYEGWSVMSLASFLMEHQLSAAPVVAADGELVGEVTLAEVLSFQERIFSARAESFARNPEGDVSSQELKAHRQRLNEYCTVNAIMKEQVCAVDISTKANTACQLVLDKDLDPLYVIDDGRLVGALRAADFLRLRVK